MHHGQMIFLDERRDLGRRSRRDHTAAHDDKRTLCGYNLRRRLCRTDHKVRVGLARRTYARLLRSIGNLLKKKVARHIEEHGTRPSAACKLECLTDRRYEIRRVFNFIVVLCDRHRHVEDVRLLKGIASEQSNVHLARDCEHGDRVHVRRREPRHKICCAWPRGRDADTDAPRRARVAIRRMGSILFMRHENLLYFILCIEGIIKRQDHPAGIAEYRVHALLAQARQNSLRTSHTHTSNLRYNDKNIIAYVRQL